MSLPPDDLLRCLAEARRGSSAALGQALEACRGYLLHVAMQELSPRFQARGGASDLVQETFIAAQQGFHQFHGTTVQEWRGWLRQILLRRILQFIRAHRDAAKREIGREGMFLDDLEKTGGALAVWNSPSTDLKAMEQQQQIEQALARLPEDYRNLLHWRTRDNLSFEEMALRLQRTVNATRQLWVRAIKRLRQELDHPHA